MIIKYKVEKLFKDKYTHELIKENSIIDVSIDRMKELNEKQIGRAVDIIVDEDIKKDDETDLKVSEDEKTSEPEEVGENEKNPFVRADLEGMTVNELKDLAEKIGCELKQAKKDEIIKEIIEFSNK